MTHDPSRIGSSFRDPSGFLFRRDGVLLRQVQERYRPHYEQLKSSGLYAALTAEGLLVPHEERPLREAAAPGAAFVLQPELLPFISLPYEWCFAQRQAAALLTLRVQEMALAHGMTLKDASAFNVQFRGVQPVLIDTLSFERYDEGRPWVAYRQFCQHFLAPLVLQARLDVRLGALLRQYLDGIPLDLASTLLPRRSWMSPAVLMHIHLHAQSIAKHAATEGARSGTRPGAAPATARVSKIGLEGLLASLKGAVSSLRWQAGTEWGAYEETHNYDAAGRASKQGLVADFVRAANAQRVIDLGANAGEYSRVARDAGATLVVAADGDPMAVERGFRRLREAGESGVHPLLVDLTNPAPAQGWDHAEWPALAERGPFDAVLALALVHHLAIGNNVPLGGVAQLLAHLGTQVIIEWVPKPDPQVQRLLSAREDIFDGYTEEGLVAAFAAVGLHPRQRVAVGTSGRTLFRFAA
ncbi:class I SAM-dependent methyltransferase [Pseudogemmatithrix spongiicola]|uniref:Class I SAM-dependent methyltransferase n=1 Tax=Pseudogemmatithrix spongiicola TaxID=3062599 RepID=A0AA49Q4H5_9BACT|nr:class I SAM-dependent methyltransferase [Gemmatimonadaceae bacterium 'strain 138']WKW14771.1 class I SAM-dependent methyltransferase [Gemmatimonadaceae bacterium 'strain 318']